MKSPLIRAKVRVNYLIDRSVERLNLYVSPYSWKFAAAFPPVRWLARRVGFLLLLIKQLPRSDVYAIAGGGWKVNFVGSESGLKIVRELLAPVQARVEPLGRVAFRDLPMVVQGWLSAGSNLVIVEHSPLQGMPAARIRFDTPVWVNQVLRLPDDIEQLECRRSRTHLLNRAMKDGYVSRFSTEPRDFDDFYDNMYVPFVNRRHGDRALVTAHGTLQKWFRRGGLLLVGRESKPIAGVVCYLRPPHMCPLEEGVLRGFDDAWRMGINAYLLWSAMKFGLAHGAKVFHFGGSHSWTSNGAFSMKHSWGAKVIQRAQVVPRWTVFADTLSAGQTQRLNSLGFITESRGRHYQVVIDAGIDGTRVSAAAEHGLDGVALVVPGGTTRYIDA